MCIVVQQSLIFIIYELGPFSLSDASHWSLSGIRWFGHWPWTPPANIYLPMCEMCPMSSPIIFLGSVFSAICLSRSPLSEQQGGGKKRFIQQSRIHADTAETLTTHRKLEGSDTWQNVDLTENADVEIPVLMFTSQAELPKAPLSGDFTCFTL